MPTLRNAATALGLALLTMSETQLPAANYDETKVPQYTLPDPLKMQDGSPVKSASDWVEKRRPEVLSLFREHVYGHAPGRPEGLKFKVTQNDDTALGGKAIRREVLITFARKEETPEAHLLIYIPKNTDGPVPAFLVINFDGNHLITPILRSPSPNRGCETPAPRHHRQPAKESNRGNTSPSPAAMSRKASPTSRATMRWNKSSAVAMPSQRFTTATSIRTMTTDSTTASTDSTETEAQ